jgi:hypothetical protein
MHFIKLLARLAKGTTVSFASIQLALERNFNGRECGDVQRLVEFWLSSLEPAIKLHPFRNPLDLLLDSLQEQPQSGEPISRYKLLIETTNDDSILRLLQERRILQLIPGGRSCTVLKLSDFPEDSEIQQANVIAGAKYAAAKGETIVLSQTDRINECFYGVFNQRFQRMVDRDGDGQPVVTYHANIAIGSHSKLCQVSPGFQCIVHLRLSELREAPAPFLNRFEKYRLTHAMLLDSDLSQRPAALRQLIFKVLERCRSSPSASACIAFTAEQRSRPSSQRSTLCLGRACRRRRECTTGHSSRLSNLSYCSRPLSTPCRRSFTATPRHRRSWRSY